MTLTDSNRNLISQALAMAASRYVEIAAEMEGTPGGIRLAQQFRIQAIETRTVAILMGDAHSVSITGVGNESEAHEDARKITAQEVIDVRASREQKAVA